MEELIYSITESWYAEFVKKQDEFVKQECIKHIKDTNQQIRIFKIDAEYQKRMILKGDDNI